MLEWTLFWLGTGAAVVMYFGSTARPGDDKRMVVAFPFLLLLAAAVAHYLGK